MRGRSPRPSTCPAARTGPDRTILSTTCSRFPPERRPPGVLLIHGFTGDRVGLSTLARRLARNGYGVLAIDLRGHGANRNPFSRDLLRQDVAAAIAIVRHSMGAGAALDYAASSDDAHTRASCRDARVGVSNLTILPVVRGEVAARIDRGVHDTGRGGIRHLHAGARGHDCDDPAVRRRCVIRPPGIWSSSQRSNRCGSRCSWRERCRSLSDSKARPLRRSSGHSGSISTPGFRIPRGSSARLAAFKARAKPSGRWRSYHGRWSRPTA